MAIKLIRKGRVKELSVECGKCNSLFTFEIEDLQLEEYNNAWGWVRYYIKCPACKEKIIYKENPFTKVDPNITARDVTEIERKRLNEE